MVLGGWTRGIERARIVLVGSSTQGLVRLLLGRVLEGRWRVKVAMVRGIVVVVLRLHYGQGRLNGTAVL
jgi:hypothetical protein